MDKLCPLKFSDQRPRYDFERTCSGDLCLWWVGDSDDGYCIVTILAPIADALEEIRKEVKGV